jgi:undecaprenyl-diphosphatase
MQAIFIGLVEGITEFLPVSSTAHMTVVPQLFGMEDPGAAFSAVVQMGPVLAIIAYFGKDLLRYIQAILRTRTPANIRRDDLDARLGWFAALATLPALVVGYLLHKPIETTFRSLYVIAVSSILFALVLWAAERVGRRNISLEQMTFPQSQGIGWAQVLAVVPGVSRSGITITAGLFAGLDRESATRFSFLLSVPVITAAGLYELLKKALHDPGFREQTGVYLLGTAVAAVSAFAVIHWLLGYVRKHSTMVFIIYRILMGAALIFLLQTGRLKDRTAQDEAVETKTAAQLSLPSLPGGEGRR